MYQYMSVLDIPPNLDDNTLKLNEYDHTDSSFSEVS